MFAHGQAELRSAQQGVVITSPQYKTVLCQQKPCQFGETCSFAHSQGQMRTVQQNLAEINPNYKGEWMKYSRYIKPAGSGYLVNIVTHN